MYAYVLEEHSCNFYVDILKSSHTTHWQQGKPPGRQNTSLCQPRNKEGEAHGKVDSPHIQSLHTYSNTEYHSAATVKGNYYMPVLYCWPQEGLFHFHYTVSRGVLQLGFSVLKLGHCSLCYSKFEMCPSLP